MAKEKGTKLDSAGIEDPIKVLAEGITNVFEQSANVIAEVGRAMKELNMSVDMEGLKRTLEFVNKYGGIDALKAILDPVTYGRDGRQIKAGETIWHIDGFECKVFKVLDGSNVVCDVSVSGGQVLSVHPSDKLTHNKPVIGMDGEPVKVGDTVYTEQDGKRWSVIGINHNSSHKVDAVNENGERKQLKAGWVSHKEPPKTCDGVVIKKGLPVWTPDSKGIWRLYRVYGIHLDGGTVTVDLDRPESLDGGVRYRAMQNVPTYQLFFQKPCEDSWGELKDDIASDPFTYCKKRGIRLDTFQNSEESKSKDVVERINKLLEDDRNGE